MSASSPYSRWFVGAGKVEATEVDSHDGYRRTAYSKRSNGEIVVSTVLRLDRHDCASAELFLYVVPKRQHRLRWQTDDNFLGMLMY